MKPHLMNLYSEIFDEFRDRMNLALEVAFRNMIEKNLHEGSVTGKIKIKLREHVDEDGRMAYIPEIEPGVSVGLKAKADLVTTAVDEDGIWNACVTLGLFDA